MAYCTISGILIIQHCFERKNSYFYFMEDKRIEKLIEELKALKVREAIVLAQLEAAVNLNRNRDRKTAPPVTTRGIRGRPSARRPCAHHQSRSETSNLATDS
jgi:hypothetical protein